MTHKDALMYSLVGMCSLLMVTTIFFYATPKIEVQEKDRIVYVNKALRVDDLEKKLLAFGVSNAWIDNFGTDIKADCFQTELINGVSLFSYCELRKPLK